MDGPTRDRLTQIALLAAAAALFVGVAVTVNSPPQQPAHVFENRGSLTPAVSSEAEGSADAHWVMLEQMRSQMTPSMVQSMREDPMWRMMSDDSVIQQMEEHQDAIDRMLARQ